MPIRQSIVVQAKLVQDRGVQIGHADAALDRLVTDVVGRAVHVPGLESAAGQEQAEGVAVVVAAAAVLRDGQPAELAGPQHDRAVEQSAALQVLDQRRRGQVGLGADRFVLGLDVGVRVPRLKLRLDRRHHLHEAHAALDQPPGHQQPRAVAGGLADCRGRTASRGRGFAAQVEHLAGRQLHSRGQLVVANARFELRLVRIARAMLFVQPGQKIEILSLRPAG